MAFISRLPKRTLYLLRGASIGGLGALAYTYFSKRSKEQTKLAAAEKSYSFVSQTELRSDLPVASLPFENRIGFVKKVYGIIALQIGAVALSTAAVIRNPRVYGAILVPSLILGSIGAIGSVIAMHLPKVRANDQLKKVCLGVFTLSEMITIPSACLYVPKEILMSALMSTGMITGGLTAYANTSKKDFTPYKGYIASLLFGFLGLSVVFLFVPYRLPHQLLAWAGAGLFSFILVHDTQKLMGKGTSPYKYGDYDIAAVSIYLDIINLFLQVLKILSANEKNRK